MSQGQDKPGSIDLSSLAPQQLSALRKQTKGELDYLRGSFAKLIRARNTLNLAKSAVRQLTPEKDGSECLVPLTETLFVPAKVAGSDKVLVDIGTGYYVEKSIDGAQELLERKVSFLRTQLEKIEEIILVKDQNFSAIGQALQMKVAEAGAPSGGGDAAV